MENTWIIAEIVVMAVLIGLNIWMLVRKRASANRKNIEGAQKRERDLDQLLANQASVGTETGRLRPYEERYASESRGTDTMVGGMRVELRVNTPSSEKKYLTTITDRLGIGTDPSNELILDSLRAAAREAVLIRERNALLFQKLAPAGEIFVERSRKRKALADKSVRVRSQDRFFMQDVVLEIRFV